MCFRLISKKKFRATSNTYKLCTSRQCEYNYWYPSFEEIPNYTLKVPLLFHHLYHLYDQKYDFKMSWSSRIFYFLHVFGHGFYFSNFQQTIVNNKKVYLFI